MSTPRRPGRGETEEDLLKQQEEFLAKKEKPSVNIVKKGDTVPRVVRSEVVSEPSPESIVKEEQSSSSSLSDVSDNISSQHKKRLERPTPVKPSWIGNQNLDIRSTPILTAEASSSRNAGDGDSGPAKKKSLFALRMEKSRNSKQNADMPASKSAVSENTNVFGDHSFIISGKEAEEIHKQNVAQLEQLSVEEIEQERKRLLSQLSSSTIKFLRERRKANQNKASETNHIKLARSIAMKSASKAVPTSSSNNNLSSQPTTTPDSSETKYASKIGERKKVFSNSLTSQQNKTEKPEELDLLATLPINPNEAKQWLHMDVLEKEKFEWMQDLPPAKVDPGPEEPYAARFDFEGLLLPYNDEKLDVNKGLHHHGDEPERPGYTLQELMQLSRSSVQQQRIMGLNTLGNVLLKAKLGIYDNVLQQNIVKELLDAGIFLLLRFSMDDLSPPVVFAALSAMRNLLFSEPDEASLDYCLGCEGGLQHPLLDVPYEENDAKKIQEQKEQEAELKDFEIIQLDVLKGAERTNLITRLGYILDVLKGPPDVVLDLLVRMARHSRGLAEAIVSCGGLLRTIRDQLLTSQVVSSLAARCGQPGYGEPSSKALRLMRVLAAQSRTIANTLLDKFNIMEPVMTYVSMSSPELPHIQGLVIHGYYLWQTLMSYGLASQSILDLFPILMRQLHFHVQLTSAVGQDASASGHELASALIGVIEKACCIILSDCNVLEPIPIFQLVKLVVDCLRKWLAQLSSNCSGLPLWSCAKMVGAALNCIASAAYCAKDQESTESKSILERIENLTHNSVIPFLSSECLQIFLENLIPSSHFLSNEEVGTKRDPSNLPSLGAMEWGGESLSPCLLAKAPHPLFSGLLRFIGSFYRMIGSTSNKLQSLLLDSGALERYIQALVTKPLRGANHWFCRQEVYMLHHLIVLIALQPALVPSKHKASQ
ncbi:RNA polymerase II-associated protein 1 [Frankliniella fusca]|uniref:RNA polymerase II-associated protein 1 n=1 Tax=Frankliniella fusca TaxID=407009 RepID=A0AAE1GTD7_9NEOP|nr:RNA polymerase II-associated protein 1 [Frankliniella fusca]